MSIPKVLDISPTIIYLLHIQSSNIKLGLLAIFNILTTYTQPYTIFLMRFILHFEDMEWIKHFQSPELQITMN